MGSAKEVHGWKTDWGCKHCQIHFAKFRIRIVIFRLCRPSLNKNIELLDNQVSTLKRKIDFNLNTIFQQDK